MSEAKLMPGKKYCRNCEPPALYCTVKMYFPFEYEQTVIKQISGIRNFSEKGGRCIKSEKIRVSKVRGQVRNSANVSSSDM